MTGEEFNIIHTKFRFFRPSPDGSIVWVVLSLPAGTMGPAMLHQPAVGPADGGTRSGTKGAG